MRRVLSKPLPSDKFLELLHEIPAAPVRSTSCEEKQKNLLATSLIYAAEESVNLGRQDPRHWRYSGIGILR